MNTANIGIMAHIDHGRTTTAERHILEMGSVGLGTIAPAGWAKLREIDDVEVRERRPWVDVTSIPIHNYHKTPPPVYFDVPNIGATGKPKRNKTKTRAARKARKRNY